jgi:high affinity Mn2+ porin
MPVLHPVKSIRLLGRAVLAALVMTGPVFAADLVIQGERAAPIYDWTGLYVGSHLGYGWGRSSWMEEPDGISDSFSLAKPLDAFQNTGSFFAGVKTGYDYMFANRLIVGAVIDVSAPSFPNRDGISIGGISLFTSPSLGPQTYSETMLIFGTARGRIGYALGDWLLYATGGYAWTYNQSVVNQLGSGPTRLAVLVALWLGGRRRRRVSGSAALDRESRISVYTLWPHRRVFPERRAGI